MRYVDTSVLIAYLIPEASSAVAEAFMLSAGAPLAISSWTEVELLSALGVKVRTRQLSKAAAHDVVDTYSRSVAPQLYRIAVDDADHRQAVILLDGWRTALRAGDGLHLAVAAAHGAAVYTLDRGMAISGATLGIPVRLLGPHRCV
ncbi:type II toxin-antitoxin system VapC family toxin [Massilia sp. RP-1-19]|uniref:Ribonuclease VapC n=1 Tax=Massilia polaris TaxID=2728846 RepID=A0A848HPR8_9BURK|nr:type II toxin-antitoxin system VapC family toxin [Massilia polaris]NML63124.1 type II toxin-antitoxin system VapC family toxin [Massilia polaris]